MSLFHMFSVRAGARLAALALFIVSASGLYADFAGVAGTYKDATWTPGTPEDFWFTSYNYSGTISSSVDQSGGIARSSTNANWFDKDNESGQFDNRYSEYTGPFYLIITFRVTPDIVRKVVVLTVYFEDGQVTGSHPGRWKNGISNNTGWASIDKLKLINPTRVDTKGGAVQLATGIEATSRTLFTFHGARDWSLVASYNSQIGHLNLNTPPMGFGWSHNFETKLIQASGGGLIVQWNDSRANKFTGSGPYTSTEDATRYDVITTVTGGGWLLTHRDQSSLLFDSSGKLIEDRDPQGRKLTLTYTSGKLSQIKDLVSNTYLNVTMSGSAITTLTDAAGKTVNFGYYPDGRTRLKTITNQNAKVVTFSYDSSQNVQMTTLQDHNDLVLTTNVYDTSGRVISQDDAVTGNHLMEFAYEEVAMPGNAVFAPSDTDELRGVPINDPNFFKIDSFTNHSGVATTYGFDANGRTTTATSGGQTTTVTYDAQGEPLNITDTASLTTPIAPRLITTVTDRNDKDWVYTFDPDFNLLSVKDPLNHTTSYTYNGSNQVLTITDPLNHTQTFTYYPGNGLLETAKDGDNKTTTYTYDSHNNPDEITDDDGHETDFDFNADNTLASVTDAKGKTTTWDYTLNAPFPDSMTLPEGGVVHYSTYTNGRLTQMTDPNGVITKFDYDANGRRLYREDHLGKRTLYTYDAVGNLRTVTTPDPDPAGTGPGKDPYVTEYQYDHRNRLWKVIAPDLGETVYGYDDNSNLKTLTNALNQVTTYDYDGEDRRWKVTTHDPDPTATGVGKDPLVTEYHYNDAGHLDWIKNPAGKQTTFTPDDAGRLDYVSDPLSHDIDYHYNNRGLPETITDPLLHVTSLTYDDQSRLYTSTDPLKRTTTFDRDELGRLSKVTDHGGLASEQGFDDDGNLKTLKNPAGVSHTLGYTNGRLSSETTPENHVTGYGYNTRGLLETITEPSTQAATLGYDDAQLLKSRADALDTITYGRDAGGRISTIVEGSKTITRVYNLLGQLESYTDGDGNVIGYLYDDAARLKKVTYPGTPTKEVHYTYDEAGRLHTVKDWADRVTTYTYYDDGRLKETLRQNNTKQLRQYDAAGRLEHLKEYAPNGTTILYLNDCRYDAANRLIGETVNPAYTPVFFTHSQSFDADNRLLTHNGESVTSDADGNLTAIAAGVSPLSYGYDIRNRLQTAGSLTYTYDAENRRVAQTVGTNATTYVINPNAALDQVLMKTVGGVTTFYVYGLGLLHEETGGVVRYYHFDRRGDTVALTDDSGTVTGRAAYGVFGEMVTSSGTLNTPFLFNGRWGVQTDANGIYYHRARYYHPSLRRFLNQDVMLGSITNGASMNRFAYANGNPVSLIDPFGLTAQDPGPWGGWTFSPDNFGPNLQNVIDTVLVPIALLDNALWQVLAEISNPQIADSAMMAMAVIPVPFGKAGIGSRILRVGEFLEDTRDAVRAYEVGTADRLLARSVAGDGLDIHHVAQAHPMEQIATGYSRARAPAIALPAAEHALIPTVRGSFTGSARSQLAKDIMDLRDYTNAPRSSLQNLIRLNKIMHPVSFAK